MSEPSGPKPANPPRQEAPAGRPAIARRGSVSNVPLGCLRVLSANLWNGRAEARAFACLVEEMRPDVVAVQELGDEQADEISRVMPHGVLQPAKDCRGMGIALRSPAAVRRVPLPFRDAWAAELCDGRTEDQAVQIVNVHVQAPHSPLAKALRRRRGQLRGLQRYLEECVLRHLAVVGDFNATPVWPLYRRLSDCLRDAALEVSGRRGDRPRPTWGPLPGRARWLRIDHAFVRGLVVSDFHVRPVVGSDHSAIVVDLSFGEPSP